MKIITEEEESLIAQSNFINKQKQELIRSIFEQPETIPNSQIEDENANKINILENFEDQQTIKKIKKNARMKVKKKSMKNLFLKHKFEGKPAKKKKGRKIKVCSPKMSKMKIKSFKTSIFKTFS